MANTHTYACPDFGTQTNVTCSSGQVSFTIYNSSVVVDSAATPNFDLTAGTWYLSVSRVSGTGGVNFAVNGSAYFLTDVTGALTSQSFSSSTNGKGLYIDYGAPGTNGTTPVVSNICITDTAGACEAAPAATLPYRSMLGVGK